MIKSFVTIPRTDTPTANKTTTITDTTTRSKPPLLRFLTYVKPYAGLIVLATLPAGQLVAIMPQGTIPWNIERSVVTLKASPCIVMPLVIFTPMAPILLFPTQTPV